MVTSFSKETEFESIESFTRNLFVAKAVKREHVMNVVINCILDSHPGLTQTAQCTMNGLHNSGLLYYTEVMWLTGVLL